MRSYDQIFDGEDDVYVPEEAINGQIPFCVFVPLKDYGLIYKFTTGKDGKLSWGKLGEGITNIFGGSTEDIPSHRKHAFAKAYGAWERYKNWKGSLPEKQPVISGQGVQGVRLPYKDNDAT
ncbi:MAG: hypothetical protein Q7R48_03740 [bacterium]|nr:hypothetical protein [bacterium]